MDKEVWWTWGSMRREGVRQSVVSVTGARSPVNASQEWYTTFFTGAALDAQRRMYAVELTRAQARFVVEQLAIEPGAEVLDVPAATAA